MTKLLASSLVLLASTAFAAAPLDNAAAIAARLGASVEAIPASSIATPAARPAAAVAAASARPAAAAVKIASLAGASGAVSGYVNATGNVMMSCSGTPSRGGWMSGWADLAANVEVTTTDGATAQFPVTGNVFLSGSCQNGGGFVNGNALLNGSGSLYKAGRYVGSVSLSGSAFINQYVSGSFAWINQSVYMSGSYNESAALAAK